MNAERKNVYEGYNVIANWFAENRPQSLMEKPWLDKVIDVIGKEGSVLDLGCGTGMPMMNYLLNEGLRVTGVDASKGILEIAKNNFPSEEFFQADMRELALNKKFDAIIAWHSFFHLPPEDQPRMFPLFKNHLNKNGVLLFTSGTEYGEAWGMNGGVNLYHGSLDVNTYEDLLESNGFRVLEYKENDVECGHANIWMAQLTQ